MRRRQPPANKSVSPERVMRYCTCGPPEDAGTILSTVCVCSQAELKTWTVRGKKGPSKLALIAKIRIPVCKGSRRGFIPFVQDSVARSSQAQQSNGHPACPGSVCCTAWTPEGSQRDSDSSSIRHSTLHDVTHMPPVEQLVAFNSFGLTH